jgi:hypothetical protein
VLVKNVVYCDNKNRYTSNVELNLYNKIFILFHCINKYIMFHDSSLFPFVSSLYFHVTGGKWCPDLLDGRDLQTVVTNKLHGEEESFLKSC